VSGRRILLLLGALWFVCATGAHRIEQKRVLSLGSPDVSAAHDSYDDEDADDGIDAAVPHVAHVTPDSDFQNFDNFSVSVLVPSPPVLGSLCAAGQPGLPAHVIDPLFRPPRAVLL
jgi:hypothetical protein